VELRQFCRRNAVGSPVAQSGGGLLGLIVYAIRKENWEEHHF
jgi:hypothetical protein